MSETPANRETAQARDPSAPSASLSLFRRLRRAFETSVNGRSFTPEMEPRPITAPVRLSWSEGPFRLVIGPTTLEFHPDSSVFEGGRGELREWMVHGGAGFYEGVAGFCRVPLAETVTFGRGDEIQSAIFGYTKAVARRHVEVNNRDGDLIVRPLDPDRPCRIGKLAADSNPHAVADQRRRNLERLSELLGRPIGQLADKKALDLIGKVNGILAKEAYRERDDDGNPGGIVVLPDDLTPLIVGDIHARIDTLLKVLSEGGVLDALERKEACLVLLGDLVHAQEAGELEEMDSLVLILDVFLMLKARFPDNVFYIRGNHESFSPDVGKGGVAQGVLLRKHLKKTRGKAYLAEVEKLFEALPFVIQGAGFAACHGAPARSNVTRDTLVNIQRYPGLQHEIVWNRLRQGNRPAGYTKGSVKRFRRTLGLPKHAPLIVAHTPLSEHDTVWLDVDEITGHHVVYSAHVHRMAAIMVVDGLAVPLEYIAEPMSAMTGEAPDAE